MTEELTQDEREALPQYLGFGAPLPEEKHNVHSFLFRVATSEDTTKLGNLTSDELGLPNLTLRANKELALISNKIMENDYFSQYYGAKGEILTSTSLSKEAKLINLAVLQKRVIEDATSKPIKENKGWFKKKDVNQGVEVSSWKEVNYDWRTKYKS